MDFATFFPLTSAGLNTNTLQLHPSQSTHLHPLESDNQTTHAATAAAAATNYVTMPSMAATTTIHPYASKQSTLRPLTAHNLHSSIGITAGIGGIGTGIPAGIGAGIGGINAGIGGINTSSAAMGLGLNATTTTGAMGAMTSATPATTYFLPLYEPSPLPRLHTAPTPAPPPPPAPAHSYIMVNKALPSTLRCGDVTTYHDLPPLPSIPASLRAPPPPFLTSHASSSPTHVGTHVSPRMSPHTSSLASTHVSPRVSTHVSTRVSPHHTSSRENSGIGRGEDDIGSGIECSPAKRVRLIRRPRNVYPSVLPNAMRNDSHSRLRMSAEELISSQLEMERDESISYIDSANCEQLLHLFPCFTQSELLEMISFKVKQSKNFTFIHRLFVRTQPLPELMPEAIMNAILDWLPRQQVFNLRKVNVWFRDFALHPRTLRNFTIHIKSGGPTKTLLFNDGDSIVTFGAGYLKHHTKKGIKPNSIFASVKSVIVSVSTGVPIKKFLKQLKYLRHLRFENSKMCIPACRDFIANNEIPNLESLDFNLTLSLDQYYTFSMFSTLAKVTNINPFCDQLLFASSQQSSSSSTPVKHFNKLSAIRIKMRNDESGNLQQICNYPNIDANSAIPNLNGGTANLDATNSININNPIFNPQLSNLSSSIAPISPNITHLRVLRFIDIEFESDTLQKIIDASPNLQILSLTNVCWQSKVELGHNLVMFQYRYFRNDHLLISSHDTTLIEVDRMFGCHSISFKNCKHSLRYFQFDVAHVVCPNDFSVRVLETVLLSHRNELKNVEIFGNFNRIDSSKKSRLLQLCRHFDLRKVKYFIGRKLCCEQQSSNGTIIAADNNDTNNGRQLWTHSNTPINHIYSLANNINDCGTVESFLKFGNHNLTTLSQSDINTLTRFLQPF